MNMLGLLRRVRHCAPIRFHSVKSSSSLRSRRLAIVRDAAWRWVEALEGRVLLSISGAQPVNFTAAVGTPYSGPVATFTDSYYGATASDYSTFIAYSNGATSSGTLSGYPGAWTISDNQTFTQAGNVSATVDIGYASDATEADGSSASVSGSATVAPAPISLNASSVSAVVGQDSDQTIATLSDSAGSYASGSYSGTLSLNGSTYDVSFSPQGGWGSAGNYNVQGDLSGLAAGTYTASLNVSETAGGQTVSAYTSMAITVTEDPILVTGATIATTIGEPWSGTIATFNPQNPNAIASNYSATIDYGNGYPEIGAVNVVNGVFTVTDSQTFYTAGNLSPTITISDAAQSVSASAAVSVDLSTISLTPGSPTATAYQSFSGDLGTLTDNAASYSISGNLAASVTLGDTTYPLSLAGNEGEYSLMVSDLPALSPGTYTAYLYAQEVSGTLSEPTPPDPLSITVQDPGINPTAVSFHADAGVPWSGAIAAFTHADLGDASNFTATTVWGDGTSSSGTITASGGEYTVSDTHTYSTPGTYSPVTTITDSYGTSAPVTSTATVDIASLSLDTTSFSLVEGQPFNGAIATLADAAGQYANPANYAATFMIGGVNYPVSLTPHYPEDGLATVNVTLPAFSPVSAWGALNITETIGAHSVSATGTVPINVADIAPVVSTSAWSGPTAPNTLIATFIDADPNADASSFTATVNYDDGSQTAATITSSTNYIGQRTYFVYAGPHTDTGVPNSTPFVSIADAYGLSASASFPFSDLQAPSGLAAVPNGPQEVDLSWTGGTGPIFVSRMLSDGTGLTTFGPIQLSSGGYYADASVSDTTGYVYTIWADDGYGPTSYPATATATTPTAGPTNFQDTITGSDGVELTWTNNEAGGVVTITRTPAFPTPVQFDNTSTSLANSPTSYIDASASEASTYVYTISRTASGVTESPNPLTITVPLLAPTDLQETKVQSGEVDLAWTDPSGVSPEFTIERTGGASGPVTFPVQSADSFQDTTAVEATSYTYSVIASLNGVSSDPWNSTITIATPLATPSNLTTTTVSTNEIDLAWTNSSAFAIDFDVYRSTDGTSFSLLTPSPLTDTSYDDTTVTQGTHYWYEVTAVDPGNPAVVPSDFSTPSDACSTPTAPTGVVATGVSPSEIDLSWVNTSPHAQVEVDRWLASANENTSQVIVTLGSGVNIYNDYTVTEDTAYDYKIRAVMTNDENMSVYSPYLYSQTATTLITAPSGLTAAANGTSEIDLSWTNQSAVTNTFLIERSINDQNWTALPVVTGSNNNDSFNNIGLTDGVHYYYKVQAQAPGGGLSTAIAADATTVLAAPSGLAAVVSGNVVNLTWTNNSLSSPTFLIERYDSNNTGASPVSFVTDPGATSYSDTSATEFHPYTYTETAQLPGGIVSTVSNSAPAYVGPAIPTNLTTNAISTSEIDLAWTNNSQATNSFLVFRSTDGVNFTPLTPYSNTITGITASPIDGTSYHDTTVTEGVHYWYQVVPVDPSYPIVYNSSFSAAANCWSQPAAPSNLAVTEADANRLELSWTNNSQGASIIYLERSDDHGATYTVLTSFGAAVSTYQDWSVAANHAYDYFLVAATPDGNVSRPSNTRSTATTIAGVTNLAAVQQSDSEINLSWTLSPTSVPNASGLQIYRSTDGQNWTLLTDPPLDPTATSYHDTGLLGNTHYFYQVRAVDGMDLTGGYSGYSAADTSTALSPPSGLTAVAISASNVNLAWTNNGDSSTVFQVERADAGKNNYAVIGTTQPGETVYTDTTTVENYSYDYQIIATGDGAAAPSAPSTSATATTLFVSVALTAGATSPNEIELTWDASNPSILSDAYEVDRLNADGTIQILDTITVPPGTSELPEEYSDTSLIDGTQYQYRLIRSSSVSTVTSDTVTATTPLAAPSAPTLSQSGIGSITLNWTNNSQMATGLEIQRSQSPGLSNAAVFTTIAVLPANQTSYIDSNFPEDAYDNEGYRVVAFSPTTEAASGGSATHYGDITDNTPSNLKVVPTLDGGLDVSWSSNRPIGTQFGIGWSSTDPTPPASNLYFTSDSTSVEIPAGYVAPGTMYYVSVMNDDTSTTIYGSAKTRPVTPTVMPPPPTSPWPISPPFDSYDGFTGVTFHYSNWIWILNDPTATVTATIDWGDGNGPQPATVDSISFLDARARVTADFQNPPAGVYEPIVTISQLHSLTRAYQFSLDIQQLIGFVAPPFNGAAPGESAPSVTTPIGPYVPDPLPDNLYVPMDSGVSGAPDYSGGPEFAMNALAGNSYLGILLPGGLSADSTVTVSYDNAALPTGEPTGSGTADDPYIYDRPSQGSIRIWSDGVYVVPGSVIPLSKLGGEFIYNSFNGNPFLANYDATSLGIDGVNPTPNGGATVTLTLNDPENSVSQTVTFKVFVGKVDLTIDSDNTAQPGADPTQTDSAHAALLEQIKDDPQLPGKVMLVNDAMLNGVPAFDRGFSTPNQQATAAADPNQDFVPLVLSMPDSLNIDTTTFGFVYSASDPGFVSGPSAADPNAGYSLPSDIDESGSLRIWTKNGNVLRNAASVADGGDFVSSLSTSPTGVAADSPAGSVYTAAQLGFANAVSQDGVLKITLYVEAVRPSSTPGDLQIEVVCDPVQGIPYTNFANDVSGNYGTDTVRLTAVQDTVPIYNNPANVLLQTASGADGSDPAAANYDGAVDLADGLVTTPAVTDISSDGGGQEWGVTREWTDQLVDNIEPGMMGNGWVVSELPTLINATTTIIANIDGNSSLYFDYNVGAQTYQARFFAQETLTAASDGSSFTLTDTVGDKLVFYGFDPSLDVHQRGHLESFTGAGGNVISTDYNDLGQLDAVTRTDGSVSETWTYAYNARDPHNANAPDEVSSVILSRSTTGDVEEVQYTYYADGGDNGNNGDLATAVVQGLTAAGAPNAGTWYYHYGLPAPSGVDELTVAIDPVEAARLAADFPQIPIGEIENDLDPYANLMLSYDEEGRATSQLSPGGDPEYQDYVVEYDNEGATYVADDVPANYNVSHYSYGSEGQGGYYGSYPQVGMNAWSNVTSYADSSGRLTSAFTNYAGEIMLSSVTSSDPLYPSDPDYADPSALTWNTGYIYDSAGRLSLVAEPSAVSGADSDLPDLFGKINDGSYNYLNGSSGLIQETLYNAAGGSGPVGYVSETDDLEGTQDITNDQGVTTSKVTYVGHGSSPTIYEVASSTVYTANSQGGAQTTTYDYQSWTGDQPTQVVTTLPASDGTASGPVSATFYDEYGRVTGTLDGVGTLDSLDYDDATGAVVRSVVSASLALTTVTEVDALGRPTQVRDPNGNVTTYAYPINTAAEVKTVITPPTGPIQVEDDFIAKGWDDTYTTDTSGNMLSLTRNYIDLAGVVYKSDRYFTFTANGNTVAYSASGPFGAKDVNYYETAYYNALGDQAVTNDLGTTTDVYYDILGRPTSKTVTAPGQVPITVETDQYDGGLAGDGNLTQVTDYPGPDSQGNLLPNRVTTNYYNWQDQQVASDNGVALTYNAVNNLGEVTESDVYDSSLAGFPAFVAPLGFASGTPAAPPHANALRQETKYQYNGQGQVTQTTQVGVDPSTGAVSTGSLGGNTYYDADGRVIATSNPGGLWTKTTYDAAGRTTGVYSTDDAGGDPTSVSGDHVLTQQTFQYDQNGNVTWQITSDRYDTTVLGGIGPTGALTGADARVSYVLNWYDAANRLTESVNYGTNGGLAPSPSSAPSIVGGNNAWAPYLVTTYSYTPAGYLDTTTDPRGIQTKDFYDMLGRNTMTIAGFTGSQTPTATNQVSKTDYDGDNNVTRQSTATVNSSGAVIWNTIAYKYIPGVAGNQPAETTYLSPDTGQTGTGVGAGNRQTDEYDYLGDLIFQIDRSGARHRYDYNAVGEKISDTATTVNTTQLPNLMDSSISQIVYDYDALGRLTDAATYSGPTMTSEDQEAYDSFGNLTDDYQEHFGPVTNGTPDVHYNYDTNFSANYSRLSSIVYPNGAEVFYNYYGNDGLDNSISRLSSISDDGSSSYQLLESYTYLGLNTVVTDTLPQINAELSYLTSDTGATASANAPGGNDAGASDPYSGLDRFGRVIDQNWFTVGGATLDRNQYAYDADSNMLYDRNLGPVAQLQNLSELDGPYDSLNRMTGFNIGHLATSGTSLDSGAWTAQSFGQNASGVYQRNDVNTPVQTTFQGVFTIPQMQDAMLASPAAPSVNAAGAGVNIASMSIQFDAWGNLSRLQEWNTTFTGNDDPSDNRNAAPDASSTATSDVTYRYDALGRRISEDTTAPTASTGSTQLYYDASGNVIEQRTLGDPSYSGADDADYFASTQYVYSPAGGNHLVLRDRNTGTGGNLGVSGSGMGERLYALRDVQGSTTALIGVPSTGNMGYVVERYLYQPSGVVTVLNASGATIGIGSGASLYNWRYLYEGSRDDGGGVYYVRGVEMNSLTGLPLREDPTAYSAQTESYNIAVINAEELSSSVTDPHGIADYMGRLSNYAFTTAAILATGGAYIGAMGTVDGLLTLGTMASGGAVLGAGYAQLTGGNQWQGAYYGAQYAAMLGSFSPRLASMAIGRVGAFAADGVAFGGNYATAFADGWALAPRSSSMYLAMGANNVQSLLERAAFANRLAMLGSNLAPDEIRMWQLVQDLGAESRSSADGIDLILKYKVGWTADQIAQADAKVAALNDAAVQGNLMRTTPVRGTTTAKAVFEDAGFDVAEEMDVDHVLDLQLGGANNVANMSPLNYSVNRSLGPQIYHATKNLPLGTRILSVTIGF